jgi:hypothetical protein
MIPYRIKILDDAGQLVAGATIRCLDDTAAKARFAGMPLPAGRAELWRGARLVAHQDPVELLRRTERG